MKQIDSTNLLSPIAILFLKVRYCERIMRYDNQAIINTFNVERFYTSSRRTIHAKR